MTTSDSAMSYRIGEVYNMYFDGTGSEQAGWRPGVIFQNNVGNAHSPNVIAIPMTSSVKKLGMPTHVLVKANGTGLRMDSVVICENMVCVSKNKIGKYITTLPDSYMKKIAVSSLIATSALCYLDMETIIGVREKSIHLNAAA